MKKILILSGDQNYARSTASSTASTALTPDTLNSGAIGFYGLVEVDSGADSNDNKMALITPTDLSTTGKISAANFLSGGGQLVTITQGYPTFPIQAGTMQAGNVTKVWKQAYTAPVKQTSFIGWNGTSGALNLPTITQNSSGTLLAVQQEVTTDDLIRNQEDYGTAPLVASETAYNILAQIANAVNDAVTKTHSAYITNSGTSLADFTGTATALKFTKGSTTVEFVIQDATDGWAASTGTVAAADVISVPHENMISITFTANILGTGAGRHIVTINGTIYNVADAGSAAQNATAIAAAINAGTQATATVSTADVTIVMNRANYAGKILVVYTADDAAWSTATLTVNTTTGETVNSIYKAVAAVSAAASFELDREFEGESCYVLGGTTLTLNTGVLTAGTAYGLKLIPLLATAQYNYALQDVLQDATITYTVGSSKGLGTGEEIAAIEKGLIAYRGQFDTMSQWAKQLPRFASESADYDMYIIQYKVVPTNMGFPTNGDINTLSIAVPSGYDGQANFETIVKALFTNAVVNF